VTSVKRRRITAPREGSVELKRQIGVVTAVLIIIADVIGTGILTTTGEVMGITGSALSILVLFAVGGLIALTGSLCYAELAAMWPEDGGEYVYLKRVYGPLPSFLTGWISLIIGFSLSAAMSSIQAVNYLNGLSPHGVIPGTWLPKLAAAGIIVFFSMLHVIGVQKGSLVQNVLTLVKLLVIFLFIALGFYFIDWSASGRLVQTYPVDKGGSLLGYGAALITIMYAYSGWNGTTYIAGEIKNPEKNLPRALIAASLMIIVIYLAVNVVFLMSATGGEIIKNAGSTIGDYSAKQLFGTGISPVFNISFVVILLSSVSVQMMIGPRVTYAMAKDGAIFHTLDRVNSRFKTPDLSIIVQTAVAVSYVFIGFNAILTMLIYMGFALSIFPLMAVIGMVYLRYKRPEIRRPYKVPLFPVVPLIFIVLTVIIMATTFVQTTFYAGAYRYSSLYAIGAVVVGIAAYYTWRVLLKFNFKK
jgi:APA family basic amino acid/polyamine antiporter